MEFWGVEVKAGEQLKVQPEFGKLIHISQASLGEVKDVKGAKYVPLRLKIDDKKFVIGSLSAEGRSQLMYDLIFEKEFELSHDWKNGSVYFLGYIADEPASDDEELSDFEDLSEDELLEAEENGLIKQKSGDVKTVTHSLAGGKSKPGKKKEKEPEPDDDDSEPDSGDEIALDGLQQEDSSDASEDGSGDDDDNSEDDESDEEEELPKAKQSKKRPAESEQKTPASKKAKSSTPDKTGKKGQIATPPPSKSAGKDKSKMQTPKSNGQLSCKSCSKTFTSGNALQSHTKAKHGGK